MTAQPASQDLSQRRIMTVSPTAVATLGLLLALIFVFKLGSLSAMAFLACGALIVVLHPNRILSETAQYGWIYLLPLWCTLTLFWSNYPSLSLRYGVQLALTFVFALTIATRLAPAIFVRLIWLAFAAGAVASVVIGEIRVDGMGWLGIYGSKNAFGMTMSAFVLASMAFVFDPKAGWFWRFLAAGGAVLGAVLVYLAQSTGAMAATAFAVAGGLTLLLMQRVSPTQRLLLAIGGGLAMLVMAILIIGGLDQIEAFVLKSTGKDATLTGRTDLWVIALQQWVKHPLLGQGYQGFWVVGNPIAEQLWHEFGIKTKSGFHFHNTWLSNVVEIGLIGVVLQLAVFGTALVLVLRWALWHACVESLFLAMFMLRQAILSMVEVVAFMQFDLATLLAVVAAIYGMRARTAAASVAVSRIKTTRNGAAANESWQEAPGG